jgi:hypothetical protein
MKKTAKKLVLSKETLQVLDLGSVRGGNVSNSYSCPDTSCSPDSCQTVTVPISSIC